jgi:hypothetical protein
MSRFRSKYRAGDWVEIRSREEILGTLDADGALDRLPFMPEMLGMAGQRYQVSASAHKTCDTVKQTGGRRMTSTVHLSGVRCDGSAHDRCQASCLIFWKEAWLKPIGPHAAAQNTVESVSMPSDCGEDIGNLLCATRRVDANCGETIFSCQATRLFEATSPLASWTPHQFIADISSRNVPVGEACRVLLLQAIFNMRTLPVAFRLTRWIYNQAHMLLTGVPAPHAIGLLPAKAKTPLGELNLQVGETVRVKSHQEILATLNALNRNRGLYFDKEMVRYCGQHLKVIGRVNQIINESTGQMMQMPTPSIMLGGAYCTSQYSERRLLCPRRIVPYWREIWLERVHSP